MTKEQTDAALHSLRARGFAVLEPLAPDEIAAMNAFLLSRPVHIDAHVPQTARNRGEPEPVTRETLAAKASECICLTTADAIVAPHLIERAMAATDVAAAYLGRDPPVSYSANAFWTRPGPAALRGDIQEFHTDKDDVRFLAMFVYLTDVRSPEDGPQDLEGPDGIPRAIFGAAGTVFLADTSRPHRGRKPIKTERGLAWWRWGVSERPPAGVWDKIAPLPAVALGNRYPTDARLRESIKLLVAL